MDRKEFDRLPIGKQIEFINIKLLDHKSLTKVCEAEKLRRGTIRDRFKSFGYTLIDGQYKKANRVQSNPSESNTKVYDSITTQQTKEPLQHDNSDPIELIRSIQKELDQLKNEVRELKSNSPVEVEPSTNALSVMTFTGTSENKSFRIDSKVLKEFDSFCKKHKTYKKQDLLSQAIKEFINKYK